MQNRIEKLLSKFNSLSPKPSGMRPGAIGTFEHDSSKYLLKWENGGYTTKLATLGNDTPVLECLCANLIRAILGPTYAAETYPVKLDCSQLTIHNKNNQLVVEEFSITESCNYGIASKMFHSDNYHKNAILYNDRHAYLKLFVVAQLLGITDIQLDHVISWVKEQDANFYRHYALIDCAGDLDGDTKTLDDFIFKIIPPYNLLVKDVNSMDYPIILEVFKAFINIETRIEDLLSPYGHIKTSELCSFDKLRMRLQRLVNHVRNDLMPNLQLIIQKPDNQLNSVSQDSKLVQFSWFNCLPLLNSPQNLHNFVGGVNNNQTIKF